MTWSYSGDPSDSSKDAVRFLVGDTNTDDQLVSNEEIDYLIALHGTVNRTASEAARAIAAKFARYMSRSIGGLQADFSAKHRQYLALADSLISKEETAPVAPFISGYKKDAKDLREEDTNRELIFGRKGVMDNDRGAPVDGTRSYY
jgi:hypothetical protein